MEKILLITRALQAKFPEIWINCLNKLLNLSLTSSKSWQLMQPHKPGFPFEANVPGNYLPGTRTRQVLMNTKWFF